MTTLNVLLTSTSDIKKTAVIKYFNQHKKSHILQCKDCDDLNLPPQPINCGIFCAFKRIEKFNDIKNNYTIIISIENDLISEKTNEYFDVANVVIQTNNRITGKGKSTPIACPITADKMGKISKYSNAINGYSDTAGEFFKSIGLTKNANNWMKEMAGINRLEQLNEALTNAFCDLESQTMMYKTLRRSCTVYPNFPKKGVDFRYFYSMFLDANNMKYLQSILVNSYKEREFDLIVPIESRGLVIGSLLSAGLGCAMIPLQKPGKIPKKVVSESYNKEYGSDELCMSCDLMYKFEEVCYKKVYKILLVDDLIATGGSIEAALKVIKNMCEMYDFKYHIEILVLYEAAEMKETAVYKIKSDYTVLFK